VVGRKGVAGSERVVGWLVAVAWPGMAASPEAGSACVRSAVAGWLAVELLRLLCAGGASAWCGAFIAT
jgi:hypothetical protein